MACRHDKRRWYVCLFMGSDKIDYLVSGFSEGHVRKHLKHYERRFTVHIARGWELCQVFSGVPSGIGDMDFVAPHIFNMNNEGAITCVVILM